VDFGLLADDGLVSVRGVGFRLFAEQKLLFASQVLLKGSDFRFFTENDSFLIPDLLLKSLYF